MYKNILNTRNIRLQTTCEAIEPHHPEIDFPCFERIHRISFLRNLDWITKISGINTKVASNKVGYMNATNSATKAMAGSENDTLAIFLMRISSNSLLIN